MYFFIAVFDLFVFFKKSPKKPDVLKGMQTSGWGRGGTGGAAGLVFFYYYIIFYSETVHLNLWFMSSLIHAKGDTSHPGTACSGSGAIFQ